MTLEQSRSLTRAQQSSLYAVYLRTCSYGPSGLEDPNPKYPEFLEGVQHTVALDGAIVVPFASMFLLIEKDGYTHS